MPDEKEIHKNRTETIIPVRRTQIYSLRKALILFAMIR